MQPFLHDFGCICHKVSCSDRQELIQLETDVLTEQFHHQQLTDAYGFPNKLYKRDRF